MSYTPRSGSHAGQQFSSYYAYQDTLARDRGWPGGLPAREKALGSPAAENAREKIQEAHPGLTTRATNRLIEAYLLVIPSPQTPREGNQRSIFLEDLIDAAGNPARISQPALDKMRALFNQARLDFTKQNYAKGPDGWPETIKAYAKSVRGSSWRLYRMRYH